MDDQILVVIPAAGAPNNRILPSYSSLPDCMIPINSKPVIGHILDDIIERGLSQVLVLLHKDDIYTRKYLEIRYTKKLSLSFHIVTDSTLGPLGSIGEGLQGFKGEYSSVLIYLGDTIYKGPLSFDVSFITVKKEYKNSEKWCFVEEGEKYTFINKPKDYKGNGYILTGVYFLKDFNLASHLGATKVSGEISTLLEKYGQADRFELVFSTGWYDIGNIENYYQAKLDFLKTRSFNNLAYNEKYGTITKSGKNKQKILAEINWYQNIPKELQVFAPRVVSLDTGEAPSYEMEFYGYQSLGDLLVFGYINKNIWFDIIDRLFEILSTWKQFGGKLEKSDFEQMYVEKIHTRLESLLENEAFQQIYNYDQLTINGKEYKNIAHFLELLPKLVDKLYVAQDICFIHGDFYPGNIIYDIYNRIPKMLDPRGSFGKVGVYGDIKYDVAKLRHSFVSLYDFIASDIYDIEHKENIFNISFFDTPLLSDIATYFDQSVIKNGYDIETIKYIEAILFLSMIPLHSDNIERQKVMYCRVVEKFNLLDLHKLVGE